MSKKDKKIAKEQKNDFEIQKDSPITKEDGTRDYFAEYYRTYKNSYIDQYLKAYHELKDINSAIDKVDESTTNK